MGWWRDRERRVHRRRLPEGDTRVILRLRWCAALGEGWWRGGIYRVWGGSVAVLWVVGVHGSGGGGVLLVEKKV